MRPTRYASPVAASASASSDAPAVEDAAEHVAAELVGAERVRSRRLANGGPTDAVGECGARNGPISATPTMNTTIAKPIAPGRRPQEAQPLAHAGSRSFGTSSITTRSARTLMTT